MSNPDIGRPSQQGLNIEIHDITVVESTSLASIDLLINEDTHRTQWTKQKDTLQTTLGPPCIISSVSTLAITLRLHYRRGIGPLKVPSKKHKDISVDVQKLLSVLGADGGKISEWQGEHGKTVVTFAGRLKATDQGPSEPSTSDSADLSSTTGNFLSLCPQFRILVIGKSGSGKSSLINAVFGVEKAKVAHWEPGDAEIEQGITSEQNERLILHDSRGFEAGEIDTVNLVQKFIDEKREQPHIKDKLHAVWLCLEIPCSGGRLMETGVEDFLSLKTSGKLGTLPLIVVYTKYDSLVTRARYEMDPRRKEGLSKERILDIAEEEAQESLQRILSTHPLDETIPHAIVSKKPGYEETIDKLITLTFSNVQKYVASEASVTVAMAQHASPKVKIDACIVVGRTKYWNGLASGTNFLGKSLKSCLEVLHVDITAVWNFEDPHQYLRGTEFQTLMYNLVNDLADKEPSNPNRTLSVGLSMVGTIAGTVAALAGPAAPIVIPIVASAVLAVWLFELYQQTSGTLRRLMAYIVGLTIIMQNLYWLTLTGHQHITRRIIKLAFRAYEESAAKAQVHIAIGDYVKEAGVFERAGRDGVLAKIVELIDSNRIEAAEMHRLNNRMGNVDSPGDDEPWDIRENTS